MSNNQIEIGRLFAAADAAEDCARQLRILASYRPGSPLAQVYEGHALRNEDLAADLRTRAQQMHEEESRQP